MTEYSKELSSLVQTDDFIKELWLDTEAFQIPLTKPAALVEIGINAALEFTNATDDTCYARIKVPDDVDRNIGMTIFLGWSTPTANAGNCRWQVEYLFSGPDNDMTTGADATLVDNFAASTAANGLVVTDMGTTVAPASTDATLSLRIKRRADVVADTLGEANHLYGICVKYLAKQLRVID